MIDLTTNSAPMDSELLATIVEKMKEAVVEYLTSDNFTKGYTPMSAIGAYEFVAKHKEKIVRYASKMLEDYQDKLAELDYLINQELLEALPKDFWDLMNAEIRDVDPLEQFKEQVKTTYQAASNGAMVLPPTQRTNFFNAMTSWMLEKMVGSVQGEDGEWEEDTKARQVILAAHLKWAGEEYVVDE